MYSCLALTDYSVHSPDNSIYVLLSQLVDHPDCKRVDVASRDLPKNKAFFYDFDSTELQVHKVNRDYTFSNIHAYRKSTFRADISNYDVILLRLPRPINDLFFNFLVKVAGKSLIINNPTGIQITSDKSYLFSFAHLCPPMQLCENVHEINEFAKNQDIVIKPLKEYGGKGIKKIELGSSVQQINDLLSNSDFSFPWLAVKFLKHVGKGDKRIIVVNHKVIAAVNRLPRQGSWLCNVAQGGSSAIDEVTAEERTIIETIDSELSRHGIVFYGIDTLTDDDGKRILSEINTLSIGGIAHAEKLSGQLIAKTIVQELMNHVKSQLK